MRAQVVREPGRYAVEDLPEPDPGPGAGATRVVDAADHDALAELAGRFDAVVEATPPRWSPTASGWRRRWRRWPPPTATPSRSWSAPGR
jgi:hypothetical protein